MPPLKPAECIVKAGEMIITWDNWHAVLNLEATLAVSGTMIDRFALPMYLWRDMVYRGEKMEQWTFMAVEAMYYDEEVFRLVVRTIRDLARNARATGAGVGSPLWPRVVQKHAELVRVTRKHASDPAKAMNAPLHELFLMAMIADPRLDDDDDLTRAVLEVRRDHPLSKLGRQEFRSWGVRATSGRKVK